MLDMFICLGAVNSELSQMRQFFDAFESSRLSSDMKSSTSGHFVLELWKVQMRRCR
jgi:hypothetical protein